MSKVSIVTISLVLGFVLACSGGKQGDDQTSSSSDEPNYGIGPFQNVEINPELDHEMAARGQKVSQAQCLSCHKLTDEMLVGPGWKGVTQRQTAEWIMNFTVNTEEMLEKDPEAKAQLAICQVRMPQMNLTHEQAREVYEFMRQNDGVE